MQILSINEECEEQIKSLREYAEQHIIPRNRWTETAHMHGDPTLKNLPCQRTLPGGWQVTFSICNCDDGTMERILTVRHESQVPDMAICNILLGHFGFSRYFPQPALNAMKGPYTILLFENYNK